ncbi:hypothetical protein IHE45_01G000200 [Dioscorea alata]|uniref:Uncharacterized protein n=1 Tax=Dioscorea alata TaxID=55571 RepID=A0ACB7WRN3_DIOAL|nr:hypothetical protein IHE45_01G000200 [Dioscorea alata]
MIRILAFYGFVSAQGNLVEKNERYQFKSKPSLQQYVILFMCFVECLVPSSSNDKQCIEEVVNNVLVASATHGTHHRYTHLEVPSKSIVSFFTFLALKNPWLMEQEVRWRKPSPWERLTPQVHLLSLVWTCRHHLHVFIDAVAGDTLLFFNALC